jgi:hypothetical protein
MKKEISVFLENEKNTSGTWFKIIRKAYCRFIIISQRRFGSRKDMSCEININEFRLRGEG